MQVQNILRINGIAFPLCVVSLAKIFEGVTHYRLPGRYSEPFGPFCQFACAFSPGSIDKAMGTKGALAYADVSLIALPIAFLGLARLRSLLADVLSGLEECQRTLDLGK